MTLKRDFDNAILTLEVTIDHRGGTSDLPLKSPEVRLLAGTVEVPAFFLATDEARFPSAKAGQQGRFTLPFWLEKSHLAGPLTLEIMEQSLVVMKEPFDLQRLENGASETRDPGQPW